MWEVCTGGGGRPQRIGFGRWNSDGEIVMARCDEEIALEPN